MCIKDIFFVRYYCNKIKYPYFTTFLLDNCYSNIVKHVLNIVFLSVSYETMPKVFTSKTQKIGELGEEIACKYLKNKGFVIIERNYTLKFGEIDIVAKKGDCIHFVEVKSKTLFFEDFNKKNEAGLNPEENMHPKKLERLYRTVETYVSSYALITDWQIDLLCLYYDPIVKKAKIDFYENI